MTSAPSAAPPAGAARRVTRADVIAIGQSGSPWAFLPLAMRAVRQAPHDAEMRLLLVANLARLGLATLAREQLAELERQAGGDGRVRAMGEVVRGLPVDRVPLETLEATCRANLEALADRSVEPVDLREHLAAWRAAAETWDWFQSRGGQYVRRRVADGVLLGLVDVQGQLDAITLPHVAAKRPGPIPPYTLEGIDPPWLLKRVADETPLQPDGYQPRIDLLQADPIEFLDGLAQADLRGVLRQPRLRLWVGAEAGRRFAASLLTPERQATQFVGPSLGLTGVRTPVAPAPGAAIEAASRAQEAERARLAAEVARIYAGRDAAWYARRFAEAADGGEPLRVLLPTCRFSTYVRHSAADLAEALEARGCRARVLIEPDDHSHLSAIAYLRVAAEFRPDLNVLINYTRANMPGVFPAEAPLVTWVQDAMPHLFDAKVGAAQGPLDFTAGNLREDLFQRFGYPRGRSLDAPIVASGRKFHCGPVSSEQRDRHECEIAYVSHHAETPEAMHERKRREARENPALAAVLDRILPGIDAVVAGPAGDALLPRLRAITARATREVLGSEPLDATVSNLLNVYTLPMADRVLRHRTLAWAAEAAERNGWRLHLYGAGWESHPALSRYARGALAHGEDLRASYRCARVHLQVSAHTFVHQRVLECALSGGLPIGRLIEDDLGTLRFEAAAAAARRAAWEHLGPVACRPYGVSRLGHRFFGYPIADHPEAMRMAALEGRLGLLADDPLVWLNGAHLERLQTSTEPVLPEERSLFWLLGDPAETMFVDAAGLERIVGRAVEDRAWRDRTAERLAARVRERLTHDAFAERLLGFVAGRLGEEAEG